MDINFLLLPVKQAQIYQVGTQAVFRAPRTALARQPLHQGRTPKRRLCSHVVSLHPALTYKSAGRCNLSLEWRWDYIESPRAPRQVLGPYGRAYAGRSGERTFYLTGCVYQLVLESQFPHKIVNLFFTIVIKILS